MDDDDAADAEATAALTAVVEVVELMVPVATSTTCAIGADEFNDDDDDDDCCCPAPAAPPPPLLLVVSLGFVGLLFIDNLLPSCNYNTHSRCRLQFQLEFDE